MLSLVYRISDELPFSLYISGTSYGYKKTDGTFVAFRSASTATYTFASGSTGSTVDLGANNNYRYINAVNVYNKGKADSTFTFSNLYSIVDESLEEVSFGTNVAQSYANPGEGSSASDTKNATIHIPVSKTINDKTYWLLEVKTTLNANASAGASANNTGSANAQATVTYKNSSDTQVLTDNQTAVSASWGSAPGSARIISCNCLSEHYLKGTTEIIVYITTTSSASRYKHYQASATSCASSVIGQYIYV